MTPMTLKELYAEARRLPREQAVELMDMLLLETFTAPDAQVQEAWGREIDQRLAEIESGKISGVPADKVMEDVRRIVGL